MKQVVSEARGELWESFVERHGDTGRDLALLVGRRFGCLTLRELGSSSAFLTRPLLRVLRGSSETCQGTNDCKGRFGYCPETKNGEVSLDSRTQGLKDSRTEGLKDSRTEGLKDSRTQGLKDSRTQGLEERTQGLKDSRTQGLKDSRTQGLKDANIQTTITKEAVLASLKTGVACSQGPRSPSARSVLLCFSKTVAHRYPVPGVAGLDASVNVLRRTRRKAYDQRRCTGCRDRTIYGGSRGSASLVCPTWV